jgi:hypothetical protein
VARAGRLPSLKLARPAVARLAKRFGFGLSLSA